MDICEVCEGQQEADVVVTVTFTPDDDDMPTCPVRMCSSCLGEVFRVMVARWNASVRAANAEVAAMCDLLGIPRDWLQK
jgi:hypothetical protein